MPFKDFFVWLLGNASGYWWEEGISNTLAEFNKRANENPAVTGRCTDLFVGWTGPGCTNAYKVEMIITCYANLTRSGRIKEFQGLNARGTNDQPPNELQQIFSEVSRCSGLPYTWVNRTITQMWHLYKAGKLHGAMMWPATYEAYANDRLLPADANSISNDIEKMKKQAEDALVNPFADTFSGLKTVAIAGAVTFTAYVAYQVYKTERSVRSIAA